MVAYLRGEPGGNIVAGLLVDPDVTCYAHAMNLLEVYYETSRARGTLQARAAIDTLLADGVIVRRDFSRAFWEQIGELKARGRISIADCFCLMLARELGGEVYTSDRHEFTALIPLGICPINFIR